MAGLPSFLQAMFTPTGPPRQRVDQGGGEYTGSIAGVYEGDDSSPVFPRSITSRSLSGPTTRRLPPPNATTGMGQNAGQDIQDAIRSIAPGMDGGGMGSGLSSMSGLEPGISSSITETALEPGGMSSISEAIQTSLPGEMSVQGGGMQIPEQLSTPSSFQHMDAGVQDTFTPGYNAGIQDSPPSFAAYKPPHAQLLDFIKPYTASLAPQAGVGQTDPATGVPALIGDDFVSEWWEKVKSSASGGTPVPTPGIQPGQTDPATGVPAIIEENLHLPEWFKNLVNPGRNFRATR